MDFRRALLIAGVLCCAAPALAAAAPQVSLHLSAFIVQNAQGRRTETPLGTRTVTAGERVRFVIEARNSGSSPALHLTPSDPIPAHMSYVPGSARDGSATVEFSLDGKTFSPHPTIKVKTAKGTVTKAADVSLYRAIRWVTHAALAANRSFTYSYEAQVNGLKKGAK